MNTEKLIFDGIYCKPVNVPAFSGLFFLFDLVITLVNFGEGG
jgi:hypothetical protein